jgi:hypothetical protein
LPSYFPLTSDTSTWFFANSLLCLLLPIGLIVSAFWISLGARPLIREQA